MRYYILKDTDEPIRYEDGKIEVWRDGAWRNSPELSGVFSGDEPIRNVTEAERKEIEQLG
ncbi:hypothetical protein SAMN05216413_2634 [Ruminococcaceae bacterium KH2T8]|nr:hypothetical protein SAMN05216413_2634 [Ruminococcaceae bacterium KH2T8]